MSYADMAAKGPKQSDEEVNYIPEIAHSDSGVHSLDSISISSHESNPFPSYAEQELAHERAVAAERAAQPHNHTGSSHHHHGGGGAHKTAAQTQRDFAAQADSELQRLEDEAGVKYESFSREAKESYDKWKQEASKGYEKAKREADKDAKKAKQEAKKAERWAEENKGNPVVIGNAVVIMALGGLLGIGAYRLHQRNELTWKVAGAWAGVVGLFAVGDYYVSQWLFQKYPPKQ